MTTASPFRKSFAVVIGIDHYTRGIPELRTAVNDARRLGELLATQHGYEVTSLLDGDATGARITELLHTQLPQQVTRDDRVLFYFAGHGVAKDADEGPNGFLLPADARTGDDSSFLQMPAVHDALLALECRHMLVILDSCFSGAFRWSATRDGGSDEPEVVHKEKYDRFVRAAAWQVISSASQDQKAIDQLTSGVLGGRGDSGDHSPFAQALFDALGGAGDLVPHGAGDGLVTASELYLYLEETLAQAAASVGKEQTPRLWPLKKHDKGEFVFFVPGRQLDLPPAPPLTFDRNPWIGLASYDASNAALFFGRDNEIQALGERITARPLTVVLGASGTGKSSLVKAGAVPKLQAAGWHVLPIMRPGPNPLAALAQALSSPDTMTVAATPDAIRARVTALIADHPASKTLLVIDQFEELITLTDATQRAAFLSLLAELVQQHPDAFRLVVTIRTDFEPNFDRSAFGPLWTAGRYVIPPMSRESLREVIEKPAAARVLYFEPSKLVDELLNEVAATPGALPLLSFALSEMYISFVKRQSDDRAITKADYDAVGGVAGALRSRAEAEFDALAPAQQETLRRVMLRMVTTDGSGVARRRVTETELDFANADERARAQLVVQRLTNARLLVSGREANGEAFVEPAHDALVRGWGRLLEWMRVENAARFPLAQQQRLTRSAAEWERAPKAEQAGQLWRDAARSAQLSPLVREKALFLTRAELEFARRSIRGRNIARATAAAAVMLIAAGGIVATIAGLRASARAEENRITSVLRTAQAMVTDDPILAATLLGSLDSAMVRKLDAASRLALIGAASQLRTVPYVTDTLAVSRYNVSEAVISPDGQWVALAGDGMYGWLYELSTRQGRRLRRNAVDSITTLAFAPASTLLAAGSESGDVELVSVGQPGAPDRTFHASDDGVTDVAFSADGRTLYVCDAVGTMRAFALDAVRLTSLTDTGPPTPNVIDSAAIRWTTEDVRYTIPAARGVVAGISGDGALRVWSGAGQRPHTVTLPNGEEIFSTALSADGTRLAVGGTQGSVRLIDLAPTIRERRLRPHSDSVLALAWSADGRQLVSAAIDDTVRLWDTRSGAVRQTYIRPGEPLNLARFAPDGRYIIAASPFTFHAIVFDTAGPMMTLRGHKDEILTAAVRADAREMVTAARDGGVWTWAPPAVVASTLPGRGTTARIMNDVTALAFDAQARHLAFGRRNGAVAMVPTDRTDSVITFRDSSATIRALYTPPDEPSIVALTYSGERVRWDTNHPDAAPQSLAAATNDTLLYTRQTPSGRHAMAFTTRGEVTFWDLGSRRAPLRISMVDGSRMCRGDDVPPSESADASCVELNAECATQTDDGRYVAVCLRDGTILLQSRDGQQPPRRLVTPDSEPVALTFSHNGRMLIASSRRNLQVEWRIDDTSAPRDTFELFGSAPIRLMFSPDDRLLATAADNGQVQVYHVATRTLLHDLRVRGSQVTQLQFSADSRQLLTVGAGEREARLWSMDSSGANIALSADGAALEQLVLSPDGRRLASSNDAQGAQLHSVDPDLALLPFRTAHLCLSAEQRVRYLRESASVSADRAAACAARTVPRPRIAQAKR